MGDIYYMDKEEFYDKFHEVMQGFELRILQMGYEEYEIVAMDIENDKVTFYMTDGKIIDLTYPVHIVNQRQAIRA